MKTMFPVTLGMFSRVKYSPMFIAGCVVCLHLIRQARQRTLEIRHTSRQRIDVSGLNAQIPTVRVLLQDDEHHEHTAKPSKIEEESTGYLYGTLITRFPH